MRERDYEGDGGSWRAGVEGLRIRPWRSGPGGKRVRESEEVGFGLLFASRLGKRAGPSRHKPKQVGWGADWVVSLGHGAQAHWLALLFFLSSFGLLDLDFRHCTCEKFQIKLNNSSQILLFYIYLKII